MVHGITGGQDTLDATRQEHGVVVD